MRFSRRLAGAAGALAIVAVAAGCSGSSTPSVPTRSPATPAVSPPGSGTPAGTVHPVGAPVVGTAFDAATHTLVAHVNGPDRLLLYPADLAAAPRTVPLPNGAGTVTTTGDGRALVPLPNTLDIVDLRTAAVRSIPVHGNAVSAAAVHDGYAVGFEDGTLELLDPQFHDRKTVNGLVSADELAPAGTTLTVLDRHQSSLTEIDLGKGKQDGALRIGEGATNVTSDHHGRVLATDTAGDQLFVFSVDPLLARQQYPVPGAPYAIAYDDSAELAWVTLTASNDVVAYDLSTGIPVEKRRLHTVAQPNSVAVDPATGTVYVGSASGAGIDAIAEGGGPA